MPIGFVVSKLQAMGEHKVIGHLRRRRELTSCPGRAGSSLLTHATRTTLRVPAGPELPSYLPCTLPEAPDAIAPSHILAIHAPDSPRTLLVPVHGLLFASRSSALSLISSAPPRQPSYPNHPALPSVQPPASSAPNEVHLPVVDLHLPSCLAFPLLQAYLYIHSPSLLLSSLLPTPPSSPSSSPSSISALLNPTSVSLSRSLAAVTTEDLLKRISLVHSLWQDVVALGISDEKLWKTMRSAWGLLAGALCVQERKRKEEMSSTGST